MTARCYGSTTRGNGAVHPSALANSFTFDLTKEPVEYDGVAQSDGALVDRLVSCPGKERTVVSGRLRVSSTGMNCPVLPSLPPILLSGFLLLIPASPSSVAVASSARMPKRSSRARDLNQLAKLITDQATGQAPPELASREGGKNPAAVALGRLGGLKGGKARAEKLSERKRKEIAKKAAAARWAVRSSTR